MNLLIPAVVFFAVVTQSLAGFGVALVAMGLLAGPLGLRAASPLMALVSITLEAVLLWRHREALHWPTVARLVVAAAVGIPVGLFAARALPEKVVLAALGAVLIGYALYSLARPGLPALGQRAWAYAFGFVAGVLGGAYNTSGPPVVIYGDTQRWPPPEFKGNLQGFFLIHDALVITGHALAGNYTPAVWANYWLALPAIVLGLAAGLGLERLIPAATFRKVVLVLLILTGLRLIFL